MKKLNSAAPLDYVVAKEILAEGDLIKADGAAALASLRRMRATASQAASNLETFLALTGIRRAARVRKCAFSLAQHGSMGLKSGE